MARSRAPRSRCGASAAAIRGMPAASTRFPEIFRMMMDTQRIIALIVFSLSALLLWESWQKHNAALPQATKPATTIPSLPAPPAPAPSNGTVAPSATSAPNAPPVGTAAAPAAAPVRVLTDLLDVEIDPVGGDIHRVTLRKVYSAKERDKPLTLMEPDPQHYFITQTGLLGE